MSGGRFYQGSRFPGAGRRGKFLRGRFWGRGWGGVAQINGDRFPGIITMYIEIACLDICTVLRQQLIYLKRMEYHCYINAHTRLL